MKSYYVKKAKYGRGIFASKNIKKGEKILVMRGNTIRSEELNKVSTSGRNILVDPFQIDDNQFMNLAEPYILINHSCDPNSGIKNRVILIAIKNIKKDQEIVFDYSSVWLEGFKCKCGQRNCRKYIGDFLSLPAKVKKRYRKLKIVPTFILNKDLIK